MNLKTETSKKRWSFEEYNRIPIEYIEYSSYQRVRLDFSKELLQGYAYLNYFCNASLKTIVSKNIVVAPTKAWSYW